MRLRISPLAAVLPAILALTACNTSSDTIGGQERTGDPITEYVSLSPSTTELLFATGIGQNKILGRTASCNYPGNLEQIPVVVNGVTPDFEEIAQIQPQRIILEKDLYSEATVDKLKELGIDVMVVDTSTQDTYRDAIIKIGKDAGTEMTASAYLDKVYAASSVFKGSMPEGARICVIAGTGNGGYLVMGQNTLLGNYIKESRAEALGPESGKFEMVSAEKLIEYNPNIIVTPKGLGKKVVADPQLKPIEAIAKGLVLDVDEDILLREGGRVNVLLESLGTGIGRIELIQGN